ncbi:MAG: hypothetical protein O3A42_19150, partial [Actinobacteria bacterium]|nr:hypothetical protein [Actinomycetota bacterium]
AAPAVPAAGGDPVGGLTGSDRVPGTPPAPASATAAPVVEAVVAPSAAQAPVMTAAQPASTTSSVSGLGGGLLSWLHSGTTSWRRYPPPSRTTATSSQSAAGRRGAGLWKLTWPPPTGRNSPPSSALAP